MTDTVQRASDGGNARAKKLTPEQRSAIAKAAATKRWAKKDDVVSSVTSSHGGPGTEAQITAHTPNGRDISIPPIPTLSTQNPANVSPPEKHCPACLNGESLEEGEGTHILATVEHPVIIPAAFQDEDVSVAAQAPPLATPKPPKRQSKPMPKEFKSAASFAERRLPQAIKEKAEAVAIVAAREAEITDLMRVIKALGGSVDVPLGAGQPQYQMPAPPTYQPPYNPPQLPPTYPEYAQPAPVLPIVTPPRAMKAGGAGVAMGIPDAWMEG